MTPDRRRRPTRRFVRRHCAGCGRWSWSSGPARSAPLGSLGAGGNGGTSAGEMALDGGAPAVDVEDDALDVARRVGGQEKAIAAAISAGSATRPTGELGGQLVPGPSPMGLGPRACGRGWGGRR